MHKTTCVVCNGPLIKRVYRRDPGSSLSWDWSKDVPASDSLHHADKYEWVGDVWCPECGLQYMTE